MFCSNAYLFLHYSFSCPLSDYCSCLSQVPIFMVSETAAELIAFTNALPEWLCKSRQEKVSLWTLESWNMKVKRSHFIAWLWCSYSLARHYLAMWSFWRRANYFCSPIYTQRACCKNFINCDSQLSHKRLRVAWLEFFFDLCYFSYIWSLKALILILLSIWAHLCIHMTVWAHLYFSNCFLPYCLLHWFCCVTTL